MENVLNNESKIYIENYIGKLNEIDLKKINRHCKRFNTNSICAWYSDWEDFCSDWCHEIGYTRTQARELLHGGKGEFQILKNIGILRYEI